MKAIVSAKEFKRAVECLPKPKGVGPEYRKWCAVEAFAAGDGPARVVVSNWLGDVGDPAELED